MREIIFWIVIISFFIGTLAISFKGAEEEIKRKEVCNFVCYKEACQKGYLNQIIHSECVDSKILGRCLSCRCSSSIVPTPTEM